MLLMLDNYDSFTANLYAYFAEDRLCNNGRQK